MTMFVQLLVFTYACALGAADELPNLIEILKEIRQAHHNLQHYVLSMDGNVPLLNDSRRHYAEIIHVVYDEAAHEDSCLGHNYYEDYQININHSAPFALANPQSVVNEMNKLIEDLINRLDKVIKQIEGDIDIDGKIDENDLEVFLATGRFAAELNKNHEEYLARSQDGSALNFVITGAEKLEGTVMALTNLRKLLYIPRPNAC